MFTLHMLHTMAQIVRSGGLCMMGAAKGYVFCTNHSGTENIVLWLGKGAK